jgi:hypothetical protein
MDVDRRHQVLAQSKYVQSAIASALQKQDPRSIRKIQRQCAPLDALSQTDLDYTIPCPGREPFITWFYCDTPHPSQVPGDDSNKFPWRVIRWFDGFRLLMQCQSFSEVCASGQRADCKVVCIRYAI